METIYTTEEVAKILKVDKQTIWQFIKNKELKAIKVGKNYRIKQSDLEQYLKG